MVQILCPTRKENSWNYPVCHGKEPLCSLGQQTVALWSVCSILTQRWFNAMDVIALSWLSCKDAFIPYSFTLFSFHMIICKLSICPVAFCRKPHCQRFLWRQIYASFIMQLAEFTFHQNKIDLATFYYQRYCMSEVIGMALYKIYIQ